ncbi:MAG: hypothetical protein Q8Q00_05190 [Dehalococcoidia bacterium]|nr:hypothetical protein [Dehalococcoidia bacterium]
MTAVRLFALSLLALAFTGAFLTAAVALDRLALPWGGGSPAEARTIVLGDASFAPVGEPPAIPAPGGGNPLVSFQGRLTNPGTGLPVANGNYSITFRIYDAPAGGNQVWTETQGTVAVSGGLFNVQLGSVTALRASDFDGTARYLEVQVSPDAAMAPRLQFGYVPYAFQAEQAGALSRLGFSLTTVDSAGIVGALSSITAGTDGLPVISYFDDSNDDLKVAHCGNTACSAGNTFTTVDSANVGLYTSITVGTDGLPVISYYDQGNSALKVAHCGNVSCSGGNTLTAVDSAGVVGFFTSITVGTDGLPVISYSDLTNNDLKVAHCGNTACSAGNTFTTVDSAGLVGWYTSITVGTDGLPVISYTDQTNSDLKVAHCGNVSCSAGNTLTAVDAPNFVSGYSSITVGTDGLPVISYFDDANDDLKVAHCGNVLCSAGNTLTFVDSAGSVGDLSSITVGADGLPVISYWDLMNSDLKVAHCGNVSCSAGNSFTAVDSAGSVGLYTSITVGTDGLPVVSYNDDTNDDLKVAHCSNRFCTPFHRPR